MARTLTKPSQNRHVQPRLLQVKPTRSSLDFLRVVRRDSEYPVCTLLKEASDQARRKWTQKPTRTIWEPHKSRLLWRGWCSSQAQGLRLPSCVQIGRGNLCDLLCSSLSFSLVLSLSLTLSEILLPYHRCQRICKLHGRDTSDLRTSIACENWTNLKQTSKTNKTNKQTNT